MKRYTVSVVRERFAEALDEVERGVPVIIERKGVRYRLAVEKPALSKKSRRSAHVEILDPAVADGVWTWDWTPRALAFRRKRRR